jgi:hypothetical protein
MFMFFFFLTWQLSMHITHVMTHHILYCSDPGLKTFLMIIMTLACIFHGVLYRTMRKYVGQQVITLAVATLLFRPNLAKHLPIQMSIFKVLYYFTVARTVMESYLI